MHETLWPGDDLYRRARNASARVRSDLPDLWHAAMRGTTRWPTTLWGRICGDRPTWPVVAALALSAAALGAMLTRASAPKPTPSPGFSSLARWEGEGGNVTDDPLPEPKPACGPSLLRRGQDQIVAHPVMTAAAGIVLGGALVALLLHRHDH